MPMRQDEFKAHVRRLNRQVWEGMRDLKALQREWHALDYGNTLETAEGEPTRAEFGAVLIDTADELTTRIVNTGHATNMAKLL